MGKPIFDWSKDDFNFNIPMYYKNQKLIYEAGDSIIIPNTGMCFSGFISNGIKALLFTIPIAKPIFASGVKFNGSVVCRGISTYINGTTVDNSAIDISTNDSGAPTNTNLSKITTTITEGGITIRIDFPSAISGLTDADNNTPITATPRGTLTITFI